MRLAFLGVVAAPGEHHVHHARGADEPRQAHRAAAADEDAAAAFGERVVGGVLRHPDVAGRRDFQPAADHGAVQHRDHRDLAELDVLECAMPAARMRDALRDVARAQFAEIEARAEMVAFARQHDGFDPVRHAGEERLDTEHRGVVDGVALFRTRQEQNRDVAVAFRLERPRQSHVEAAIGFAHRDPQISHLTWVR